MFETKLDTMADTGHAGIGDDARAAPARVRITLFAVAREFAGHRDHWLFMALFLASAGWLLATGPAALDLAWLVLGWIVFMPQEYFTHVYVLHCPLPRSGRVYLWLYRLHYGHHDFPKRDDLMYMPLWLTIPMMVGNLLLLWLITPDARAMASAFCGTVSAYLVFEWAHLLCHVPYVPKSKMWRHARSQHLLHHFYDEKQWYAVTPGQDIFDRVMGSKPAREKLARSTTCRLLGLDPAHPWLAEARARFATRSSGDASASRLWTEGDRHG